MSASDSVMAEHCAGRVQELPWYPVPTQLHSQASVALTTDGLPPFLHGLVGSHTSAAPSKSRMVMPRLPSLVSSWLTDTTNAGRSVVALKRAGAFHASPKLSSASNHVDCVPEWTVIALIGPSMSPVPKSSLPLNRADTTNVLPSQSVTTMPACRSASSLIVLRYDCSVVCTGLASQS